MPITHKFVSGKAASGDATLVDGPNWDDTHNAPPFNATLLAALTSQTNAPSAVTEFTGSRRRLFVDLTHATEFRSVISVTVAGAAGTVFRMQYSPNDGVDFFEFAALASVNIPIDSIGNKRTAWVALPDGAKTDVLVRMVTQGGDGAADPQLSVAAFQYR